ncbi:MAG: YceI family protein [Flavobacteriales bacterium]|nr:YceI family protein [Flavobacteriales bacterium]
MRESSKRAKCQCGKTKDPNGNCDGSHANTNRIIKSILFTLVIFAGSVFYANATSLVKENKIDVKTSTVTWKGHKVTGSHEGEINVASGSLSFENKKLTGGEVIIDMNSIVCTDLTGVPKGKLEGHLKSDDFFSVTKFPRATLKIVKVSMMNENSYECMAELNIKGHTEEVFFNTTINKKGALTKIKIDRTKFNVKYGSGSFFKGLGDKMIYDEFDLVINLSF